jgi:hypothetical protein
VATPSLDQDLGHTQAEEDLTVQKFVSEPCVEALAIAFFPRRSWCDEGCLGTTAPIQARTFLATNSAPLYDLMNSGGPRRMNRSPSRDIAAQCTDGQWSRRR